MGFLIPTPAKGINIVDVEPKFRTIKPKEMPRFNEWALYIHKQTNTI